MKLITFVGSLREKSYNKALAMYVQETIDSSVEMEIVDIDLPYFNEDIEANKPEKVNAFLAQVEKGDAFLFVTPEYNHSVPGGLKNAIDWASRGDALTGKPAFVMGASPGAIGAERAQLHLRQILDTKEMRVLPGNEVIVASAYEKIIDGVLTDADTKSFIDTVVKNFISWYNLVK